MSLIEFEPPAQSDEPIISIGMLVGENSDDQIREQFSYKEEPSGLYPGKAPLHLFIDGQDRGAIDWEIDANGEHGYIDGIDAIDELKYRRLRKLALNVIIECLHDYNPDLETLDYLDRQEVFKKAA